MTRKPVIADKATRSDSALSYFFTINQIADRLGVSTRTVRRWIEGKLLIVHRINGLVRISDADYAAFLAARRDA